MTVPVKEAEAVTEQDRETKNVTAQAGEGGKLLDRTIKEPGRAMEEEQAPETVLVQAQGRATVLAPETAPINKLTGQRGKSESRMHK